MMASAIMLSSRRLTSVFAFVLAVLLLLWYLPRPASRQPIVESTSPFKSGTAKPAYANYTRTLVIGRLAEEDVSWIGRELPGLATEIYIVDAPPSELRIPRNKGHEAMVYLTYIVDHYDSLADTTLFFHPHLRTWHNNDLLDSNAANTIRHLNDAHVARVGYFNTRCHHEPGCPDWLHIDRPEAELNEFLKMEEKYFTSKVWKEMHPGVPPPAVLSQPCCAQFAVSRDRIRSLPKSEYERYRNWILNTQLTDQMSGRIMEYSWQYIFTGLPEVCPAMHVCYCDGYGVCFGGAAEFQEWFEERDKSRNLIAKAADLYNEGDIGQATTLRMEAAAIDDRLELLKKQAFERGKDPKNRALECGRPWKEGDGF